jgi:hypothetical protein
MRISEGKDEDRMKNRQIKRKGWEYMGGGMDEN